MRLFVPGTEGREYASALAPETKEAPSPYNKGPTPILVIRQRGEAWARPFAVIYEPRSNLSATGGIQSVAALTNGGRFGGFRITSRIAGRTTTQLVLTLPAADSEFTDATLGLAFRGRYAVVTLDSAGKCSALYLGEGSKLSFQGVTLSSVSGASIAASADINGESTTLTAPAPAELTLPGGKRIASTPPKP